MENKNLEYIILYLIVGCAALLFAAMARLFSIVLGIDNFTANVVFFIAIGVSVVAYLSIRIFLENIMLPWIEKTILSMSFFQKRVRFKRIMKQNNLDKRDATQPNPNIQKIREAHIKIKIEEKEKARQVAIFYTKTVFAPFISDDDFERLCSFVEMYSVGEDLGEVESVNLNPQLNTSDLYHFGWNIWNHFKVSKQIEVATFLKNVFPEILNDVETETIKRHLKDDELKCVIKIQKNLSM